MRKRLNRNLIPIYRIVMLLIILGIFSTIFALFYSTNSKIMNRVTINDIKVSGLSKTEAINKFNEIIKNISDDEIVFKHGDYEKTFTLSQIDFKTDMNDKIHEACMIGRESNIFSNNYKILKVLITGENLDLNFSFNEEVLKSFFSNLDDEWEGKFVDNSYYIDGDKLVITKGSIGDVIDEDTLRQDLINLVYNKITGEDVNTIDIPVITKEPSKIDLAKIQTEIYKEPKDASLDKLSGKLSVQSNGIDFGISIEEAENILLKEESEYIIPLKITKPSITTDMFGEDAFPDILAKFSTRYDSSNINRATNLDLAASTIDGTVLLPGERFSFNNIVGPTTASKGYKLAGAYSAGELVENYGGGICQVSSTIYDTALYANLKIVERHNHSSVVSYLDPGLDATISYGSKDLKFENSRNYAIKINARATNGILEVEIMGISEENEYEIELVSKTNDIILCDTKYKYDSSLSPDEEVVETLGANGAKSTTYKITKRNGSVISEEVLSEDRYNPMTKVIRTGKKNKK